MKIRSIEAIPLRIEFKDVFRFGSFDRKHSNNVIIRIRSDEGVVGYGEACPVMAFTGETQESIVALVESRVSSIVVGQDVRNVAPTIRSLERALRGCPFTLCAVDIAMWDLLGKVYKQPISALLGGSFRDTVELHGSIGWADGASMVETARMQRANGFRSLKLYLGRGDLQSDLRRLEAVREAVGPEPIFLLDINQQWDARSTLEVLPRLHALGVTLLEQPLPGHDHAGQAEVVRAAPMDVAADESIFSCADVAFIGKMRTARTVNLGISKMGGLLRAKESATVARSMELGVLVGSVLELGIATAAALHFAASIEKLPHASYLVGPLKYERDITSLSLDLAGSSVRVPVGPGLGIEVDEEAIAALDVRVA